MQFIEIEYNDDRLDEIGLLILESKDQIIFEDSEGDLIEVDKKDLHEWTKNPGYPQKIGFKKGKVIKEIKIKDEKQRECY
jgi:hypothetical protein